jgi:hypothetical protein
LEEVWIWQHGWLAFDLDKDNVQNFIEENVKTIVVEIQQNLHFQSKGILRESCWGRGSHLARPANSAGCLADPAAGVVTFPHFGIVNLLN